jgi:hypothetical protein
MPTARFKTPGRSPWSSSLLATRLLARQAFIIGHQGDQACAGCLEFIRSDAPIWFPALRLLLGPGPVVDAEGGNLHLSMGLVPATGFVAAAAVPKSQPTSTSAVRKAVKTAAPAAENCMSHFALNKLYISNQLVQIGATPKAFESATLQVMLMQTQAQNQTVQSSLQQLQALQQQQQKAEAAQKQARAASCQFAMPN